MSPAASSGNASDAASPLVVVTHYYPAHGGGVEIVALEMVRRMARAELPIVWFATAVDTPPQLEHVDCRPVSGINLLEKRLGIPWPIWSPLGIPRLWKAIGSARAVHLHDSLYMGNVMAALIARLRGKPLFVTQHVGLVPYKSAIPRVLMTIANTIIARPLLRNATKVGFISEAVQSYFSAQIRWKRAPAFVPNGVDTGLFHPPTPEQRAAARAALKVDVTRPVFLFVGRFVEKKGLPLLSELVVGAPDSQWLFAGDGPIDPEKWGAPNVRVFRGRRRESLRELIWAADLMVLPSFGEGFPLVIQEAVATGLPALVPPETVAGFPLAKDVLLSEPLGDDARARWSARLQRIAKGEESLPSARQLSQFAVTHWDWARVVQFYEKQFTSPPPGCG